MYAHHRNSRGFNLVETAIVLGIVGIIMAAAWGASSTAFENLHRRQFAGELETLVTNIRAAYAGQAGIYGGDGNGGIACTGVAAPPPGPCAFPDILNNNNWTTLTGYLAIQSIIPGDMIDNRQNFQTGYSNIFIQNPWGANGGAGNNQSASLFVCSWIMPENPTPSGAPADCMTNSLMSNTSPLLQYFAVELEGLTVSSCIAVAVANSSANGPPGLVDVVINGNSIANSTTTGFPVHPLDASNFCPQTSPFSGATGATIDFVYTLRPPMH